jgi:hypothetical protein
MRLEKAELRAAFIKSFIDKLGDVKNWNHTGNVIDLKKPTGFCICGHAIRYMYELKNNEKLAYVGSECINHFQDYSPELFDSLNKTIEKMKDEEKRAKELLLNEEIQKILIPYRENVIKIKKWFNKKYEHAYCYDYPLYKSIHDLKIEPKKNYKSLKSLLNWYNKNNKITLEIIAKYL